MSAVIKGKVRIWETEVRDDRDGRGSYTVNTKEFRVHQVQVLHFLSETRAIVALIIGGTPFAVDVDDLTVVGDSGDMKWIGFDE